MPRHTIAERESLKKAVITATIHRLTVAETQQYVNPYNFRYCILCEDIFILYLHMYPFW